MSGVLRFEGCQNLRQRLILATLCGRAVRIDNIRSRSENPGLRDFEASLLRLLEKVTDGCLVEINETGPSNAFSRFAKHWNLQLNICPRDTEANFSGERAGMLQFSQAIQPFSVCRRAFLELWT